ncbi:hypothetical protein [Candidatus Poriferisodalis sp.]|uniref:hypothetical protein n=1 Tax=Candidatus Poriferisodalis sp. TaxID=3101277 RepID=UPI003B58D75A
MMRPTIDELIDNGDWDEVARRFEGFDVERAVRRPISDWWLRCAAGDPKSPDDLLRTKVAAARADGVSWQRIGELLGVPEAEAQQRYDSPSKPS